MTLEIPYHLVDEVQRLVNDHGYTPEAAVAKAAYASVARQNRPGRDEAPAPEETPVSGGTGAQRANKSLTVVIPAAPAKDLMPNQQSKQGHWSTRSRARKAFRSEAMWQAGLVLPHNWHPLTGPVALSIHVKWPGRRRPDLDAVPSACKAAIDGLADAGVFQDDRQVKGLHATHEYGAKGAGETRFTITEMQS